MKTRLFIFAIILSLTGCNSGSSFKSVSNKIQYDLINEVLNQYVFIPSGDDVQPVRYTGCIFQIMPGSDKKDPMKKMIDNGNNLFTPEDQEYMKWQVDQTWNRKINGSFIDNYNITVIKDRNKNLDELCNSMLLFLSPPIFTVDKQHALLWQSLEYKDLRAAFILTLQKQKNRWVMISYEIIDGN